MSEICEEEKLLIRQWSGQFAAFIPIYYNFTTGVDTEAFIHVCFCASDKFLFDFT